MDKTTHFLDSVLVREQRLAVLIGVNAGLQITGGSVRRVTNAAAQTEAALAIHERYQTDVLLTAMDLSAEAKRSAARCSARMKPRPSAAVVSARSGRCV